MELNHSQSHNGTQNRCMSISWVQIGTQKVENIVLVLVLRNITRVLLSIHRRKKLFMSRNCLLKELLYREKMPLGNIRYPDEGCADSGISISNLKADPRASEPPHPSTFPLGGQRVQLGVLPPGSYQGNEAVSEQMAFLLHRSGHSSRLGLPNANPNKLSLPSNRFIVVSFKKLL